MQYIVLDFEMCQVNGCDARRYPYKNEIIQIGAVKLNEHYEILDEFNCYIRPEYGVISKYIQSLTGIYNSKVKKAETLKAILPSFVSWCGIGTTSIAVITWSENDYNQLKKEIRAKDISFEGLPDFLNPEQWIDYQNVFGTRYHFDNPIKLSDALTFADIEFEGHHHDGLCDAYNTAKLFSALELDPNYQLIQQKESTYIDTPSIGISLGDLLTAKLNISLVS